MRTFLSLLLTLLVLVGGAVSKSLVLCFHEEEKLHLEFSHFDYKTKGEEHLDLSFDLKQDKLKGFTFGEFTVKLRFIPGRELSHRPRVGSLHRTPDRHLRTVRLLI
ncbi:MAG: hypothetical protein GXN96_00130 [Aquificae bacterium]|nr:hypothetical protein [Aquificota bacterium]